MQWGGREVRKENEGGRRAWEREKGRSSVCVSTVGSEWVDENDSRPFSHAGEDGEERQRWVVGAGQEEWHD